MNGLAKINISKPEIAPVTTNEMIMRLLLLFPNIFILSIAGYNLFSELESGQQYYMAIALHASVTALCVLFLAYLLRSAFKVDYVETDDEMVTE